MLPLLRHSSPSNLYLGAALAAMEVQKLPMLQLQEWEQSQQYYFNFVERETM